MREMLLAVAIRVLIAAVTAVCVAVIFPVCTVYGAFDREWGWPRAWETTCQVMRI